MELIRFLSEQSPVHLEMKDGSFLKPLADRGADAKIRGRFL